eukprot:m.59584 g.59584  ORF g.59584 m.59584 type:complete len:261 (-) comp13235_c2_seq2:193-975(-)
MAGESHRLSPHVDLENSLGKRLDNEDNGDERRSSCASYAARTCSTIGLICVVIAIATPSWINQILTVQAGGNQSADITIGRGFFQMYYYDHHGLFLLYNNREHDFAGQSADVFCGPSNATTQFPLLEPVSRHNNERDWCGKRAAALGLSLTIATLGVFAFASSHLMGYGCGDDSILFLFTSIAALLAFIVSCIIGSYSVELRSHLADLELPERMFPYPQVVDPGYSYWVFLGGTFAYIFSCTCALVECGRDNATVEAIFD